MTPPRGFSPFSAVDGTGINERRIHFTHRRRIRSGWAYWSAATPREIVREVWISPYARSVTVVPLLADFQPAEEA